MDEKGLIMLALSSLVSLLSSAATAQSQPAVESALREARPLFAARRYAEAHEVCAREHAGTPSGQLLRCMALARNGEGRLADAERHVAEALAMTSDAWVAAHRDELEAMRAQWWQRLGQLDVLSSVEGALVRVDGQEVGRTPLLGFVIEAGQHRVELEAEGYEPHTRDVMVGGTDASLATSLSVTRVNVELRARRLVPPRDDTEDADALRLTRDDPQRDEGRASTPLRRRWWLWTSVGVAAAVIVVVPTVVTRGDSTAPLVEGSTGRVVFTLGASR